ncbi:MAG: MgtC/SapB family protein [Gammaproteobacteria bacterium]|nr:MgtC/SapB family protein [Gammaproteobacteria bacterium]
MIDVILSQLLNYWSKSMLMANIMMILNLLGALGLGLIIGYERSYHGRAAGMRTYGLVSMASAALIVILGHPEYWYGAQASLITGCDPTRVIQGIVTGLGFLCAGVILKDGFSITGLTTAASIWACSVMGILVGLGFYFLAIAFTALQYSLMMWMFNIENYLPSKHSIVVNMKFDNQSKIKLNKISVPLKEFGYKILTSTISLQYGIDSSELHLLATTHRKKDSHSITSIAEQLKNLLGVTSIQVSYSRN